MRTWRRARMFCGFVWAHSIRPSIPTRARTRSSPTRQIGTTSRPSRACLSSPNGPPARCSIASTLAGVAHRPSRGRYMSGPRPAKGRWISRHQAESRSRIRAHHFRPRRTEVKYGRVRDTSTCEGAGALLAWRASNASPLRRSVTWVSVVRLHPRSRSAVERSRWMQPRAGRHFRRTHRMEHRHVDSDLRGP